jgi:hypothetical protein
VAQVTVFEGPLDTLSIDTAATDKAFTGDCLDGWSRPGAHNLSTPVHRGKRTGDLIRVILDAIGWPDTAETRSIDWGATTVPYWWLEGVDARTAVTDLVHSEGPPSIAWVQNGCFYFRDRHHRVTLNNSLTSQGTYTHTIPAGPIGTDHKILKNAFHYDHGLDYIINSATLEVAPWVPQPRQTVWSTTDPIVLGGGESVTFVIRADNAFIDLQTPSALVQMDNGELSRDYIIGTGSIASFGLSRTSGQSAYLTITAGGGGVYLENGIKVRGSPLQPGAARQFTATDPASQATYGDKDWDGTAPWAHYYDAQALVSRVVAVYASPQPSVTFEVEARLGSNTLTRILGTAVSDRITVRNDEMGLAADFHVEQGTHTVQSMGVRHRMTIGAQVVEPTQAANAFTFDVSGKGFGQGQFSLDSGLNPATMMRFDTGPGFDTGVFSV